MKTTLITQNIDGYEIVCGLSRAVIDPVQAKAAIDAEITSMPEYVAYTDLKTDHENIKRGLAELLQKKRLTMHGEEIAAAIQESAEYQHFQTVKAQADLSTPAGIQALSDAWNAYKAKERELTTNNADINAAILQTEEYQNWLEACATAHTEISAAYQLVLAKRREIVENGEIHFTPKAGEAIITDEEAATIKSQLAALPEKSRLVRTGEVVEDRRGETYWTQDIVTSIWTENTVAALNEELPVDAIYSSDLTDATRIEIAEQKEEARIDAMTAEEKQAEFDQIYQKGQRQAVYLRSEKEIGGMDPAQALSEAQAWLADYRAELVIKYGIIE